MEEIIISEEKQPSEEPTAEEQAEEENTVKSSPESPQEPQQTFDEPEKDETEEESAPEEAGLVLTDDAAPTPEPSPEAPLEIYAEKTNGESSDPANGTTENGGSKDSYVITNKEDPTVTSKIQVYSAPNVGTAAEPAAAATDEADDIQCLDEPKGADKKEETVSTTVGDEIIYEGTTSSSSGPTPAAQ
jgi:hypothetical protein